MRGSCVIFSSNTDNGLNAGSTYYSFTNPNQYKNKLLRGRYES